MNISATPADDFGAFAARFKLTESYRPYLLLTLLCLCLFAPGLAQVPPTDRDESRFMQATKQMIETGDYVDIRFQDEARNKKPVGVYWLQAAAVTMAGKAYLATPWPYRLPSALAAWLAVLGVCAFGRRLFGPASGLAAGAMLATTLVVVAEAHLAKTDAALLCAVTFCLTSLGHVYLEGRARLAPALLFWITLAAGILIKGPVIIAVAGATIAALTVADRDLRWLVNLRPFTGLLLLTLITAPWFLLQSSGPTPFISSSFHEDILPKLIGGQEGHGAPPGTHLLLSLVTAWPWSVLAPFALIAAWRGRSDPATRFCLAWLAPAWLLFELVPTKLPHYTLPLMPPLMLLTAALLRTAPDLTRILGGGWALAWRIIWSWTGLGLGIVALVAARRFGEGSVLPAAAAAGITLAAGLYGIAGLGKARTLSGAMTIGLAGAAFMVVVIGAELPRLSRLAISDRIAGRTTQLKTDAPVALAGYHEPSAIFLLGTGTILTDAAGATAYLIAHPAALAVVPAASLDVVRAALEASGRDLVQIERIDGYNYSRGRQERLVLVSAKVTAKES
ncbi:MAG: ArnT family glycosyltransferase [Rhodospirillaceae bacterium]